MGEETLEDQLRKATRNFTSPLAEDQALALGRDLLREIARAQAETPPRCPVVEPKTIALVEGRPRLEGGGGPDAASAVFEIGALLFSLLGRSSPEVSWWLDGPPPAEMGTLARSAALRGLVSSSPDARFPSAAVAAQALENALLRAPASPSPWATFRGSPERTGARPGPQSASKVTPLWSVPLGAVVASPVLTAAWVVAATADGRLVWLDRETGRRLYERKVANAVESSPALDGGRLYLGTDDGELVAVDAEKGTDVWRVRIGTLVRSSPLVADDRVLVGVVEGKEAGGLASLDAAKGKLVWKRKTGAVFSSPAKAGTRVLVGSDDGSLHALDLEKGAPAWSSALGGRVRATPAVAADVAVVSDFEGRVAAVQLADGKRLWTRELGASVYSSACLTGSLAAVGCHDASVYALSLAGGESVFTLKTRGPVVSSPIAAGERVVVPSTDGELLMADALGQVLARASLSAEGAQSSPALDRDTLVVGSARGLHAFRLEA
ncbi:MAG TPA: PQQ-binding-like beta-propeller repeat protein [Vicinamibacteria bacterium]